MTAKPDGRRSLFSRSIVKMRTIALGCRAITLVLRAHVLSQRGGSETRTLAVPEYDLVTNPSLVRHDGGWMVAMRAPSYTVESDGRYRMVEGATRLESRSIAARYDHGFQLIHSSELAPRRFLSHPELAANGLEDPRFVVDRSGAVACLWSGLSLRESQPAVAEDGTFMPNWAGAKNTMFLGKMEERGVEVVAPMSSPVGALREKNWMPVALDDGFAFVHHLYPLRVLAVGRDYGGENPRVLKQGRGTRRLRGWSGSSQLVPWGEDWIAVVHFAGRVLRYVAPWKRAVYLHRLVRFDRDFSIVRVSSPFVFEGYSIEFCAGLAIDEDRAYMSYGVGDERARVITTDIDLIRTMVGDR